MHERKDAKAQSVASQRLQVTSFDDFLDEMMERIPRTRFDLSNEAVRQEFRGYLRQQLTNLLTHLAWDFSKAAERGVLQVAALIEDPDFYETTKRRKAGERKRRKEWAEENLKNNEQRRLLQAGYVLDKEGKIVPESTVMVGCNEEGLGTRGCWHQAKISVDCPCGCHEAARP